MQIGNGIANSMIDAYVCVLTFWNAFCELAVIEKKRRWRLTAKTCGGGAISMVSVNDRLNLTMSIFDDALIASSCDDAIVTEILIGSLNALPEFAFLSAFFWTFLSESFAVKVIEIESSIQSTFDFDVNESTIESGNSIESGIDIVDSSSIVIEKKSWCA